MIKEDPQIKEESDRENKEKTFAGKNEDKSAAPEGGNKTEVKNSSAAGLGAIGRNDQTEEDPDSPHY